jgi:tRNA pseudouridine32 synthase/23S rRNA pseudouridine746 synthase
MVMKDDFFIAFKQTISPAELPRQFTLTVNNEPHPLCVIAARELQAYLENQKEWRHNFGLGNEEGLIIGKMFGVLVVQDQQGDVGYLAAFSGKLADTNTHAKFVPPVFDLLTENSFLNKGMQQLNEINREIKHLQQAAVIPDKEVLNNLMAKRKQHSIALQHEIFEHYHFTNQVGEERSLIDIFKTKGHKNPPAGAGECAGPKLLQYAFQHQLKPLALTEFWWGQSPKSATWKHKQFYACCKEKCEPILAHMLDRM